MPRRSPIAPVAGLLALVAAAASAYGPEGHLIAGRAAEPLLCERAAAEIRLLGGGDDLGELGLWADRIRADERYADAAPWHYMNIDDDVPLDAYEHPPEGDVLWAIGHFSARLRNRNLEEADRAEALRFLVHFVVDLHQPLHVGLARDRGGNAVELEFRGEPTNLHRLWDTDAIDWMDRSVPAYTREVGRRIAGLEEPPALDPRVWAAESLALRGAVYDYGAPGREPTDAYLGFAARTTERRLALAAQRLAATLDSLLCAAGR